MERNRSRNGLDERDGTKSLHEHPAYVQINLTDAHVRFTLPDGTTKEVEAKAGQTSWNEPQKHSAENPSSPTLTGPQGSLTHS